MAPHHWSPLQQHSVTGEPFLRLPAPHNNIIITPFRAGDKQAILEVLNDPKVYMNLTGPPYPYRPEDADWWLAHCAATTESFFEQCTEATTSGDSGLVVVGECPVQVIREQREDDGTEVFLGACSLIRSDFSDIVDHRERETRLRENNARQAGDPSIVWQIGGV
jgi:hypothetical protein